MEMVKVKVQTSPAGTFPTPFAPALTQMRLHAADTGFPFRSLVPLWSRQIPYTIVSLVYSSLLTRPKSEYSKATQLGVTFGSGYAAGIICAVVSHPADSVVSLMGKASNKGKSIGQIIGETGVVNLMSKGLGTRVIMIGTLTGLQWWIYDSWKTFMGLGTTGGK
ncbi:MAG: hypothetical protein BJ554DRAFT_4051 [Olpidium bornovanus]|uniref:Mitochondrial carrier protein n=1 Tax=Olpidium bornovanus TaxID=278681 RepID=A0A8H7ZNC9_9FUNG|nr:MAG: hypothetical protein BJ554DRAFT_4051 [Olpidium bornovanus]